MIRHTISAIDTRSSSKPSMRRVSRPGTIWRRTPKTRCSRLCLHINRSIISCSTVTKSAYSAVNDSSGSSACSPSRNSPLVSNACMLHNACTVRPKWRPWETRGSDWHLRGTSSWWKEEIGDVLISLTLSFWVQAEEHPLANACVQ